jgi:hypothetical protein
MRGVVKDSLKKRNECKIVRIIFVLRTIARLDRIRSASEEIDSNANRQDILKILADVGIEGLPTID